MDNGTLVLAHHGIMGMKWGVWNAETQRKYGGGTQGRPMEAIKASRPNNVTGGTSVEPMPDISKTVKNAVKKRRQKRTLESLRKGDIKKAVKRAKNMSPEEIADTIERMRQEKAMISEALNVDNRNGPTVQSSLDKGAKQALEGIGRAAVSSALTDLTATSMNALGSGAAQLATEMAIAKMAKKKFTKKDRREAFKRGATASLVKRAQERGTMPKEKNNGEPDQNQTQQQSTSQQTSDQQATSQQTPPVASAVPQGKQKTAESILSKYKRKRAQARQKRASKKAQQKK